ncbi:MULTISPECIES: lysophospholipid acyltransferase family protein [Spirulina sp. CCY15215]|uniref:lysophospholipid acyltransferase family protein n=1 Tax=Spirulina sp. CCY15215 TaxID=2767591 RepID=UPI00194E8352|nr:lysophospholipid acyltransferase family protein [Spirulina major]
MTFVRSHHPNLTALPNSRPMNAISPSNISPWLARIAYPLGRYCLLPFYFNHIEVNGQENIPLDGPVLLAPTHRSRWDALILAYAAGRLATGRDPRFMVSSNEMNRKIQGWFIRNLGGFAVNPKHPNSASLSHSIDLLCQGEMLAIFPEGDIYHQRCVESLKRGLAAIALQAQAKLAQETVKIVPISIHYSQLYPRWGCDVKVDIGNAIEVSRYGTGKSSKKVSQKLTADLEDALKGLHELEEIQDYVLC